MLKAQGVSAELSGRKILDDISFALCGGEIIGLLGPNGAGKSTLLSCLAGGMPLASGSVRLAAGGLDAMSNQQIACRLSVLTQTSSLSFPFAVESVVAMGRFPHASGAALDTAIVEAVMDALELLHLRSRSYMALSGGEKQRVQLARAICQVIATADLQPLPESVLLLDEPVAALDLPQQLRAMELLVQLRSAGLAVLMVLHDMNLTATYANRVMLLKDGLLLALDKTNQVMQAPTLEQLFGIPLTVMEHPSTGRPLVVR